LIVSIVTFHPASKKACRRTREYKESEMKETVEVEVVKSRLKSLRTTRATERKLKGPTRPVLAA
jgi:hypothetical protein